MDSDKLKTGSKITKSFQGGSFEENKILRKAIYLLFQDIDRELLSDEEKLIYDEFIDYNNKVEALKNG